MKQLTPRPGKRPGQKYKSLLVLQYLLKNADDENAVTMSDILSHLSKYGIEADRRSVYRDIHDLVELLNTELQEEERIPEWERLGYEIVFTRKPTKNSPQGGYLVTQRPYEFDELRLLTECVNSARFLSESQARNLRSTISRLCSREQAKLLNTESLVVNREKVTMRFLDLRLDTVVDQFGTVGVKYEKVDETHFTVQAEVEVSDMFYAWVCGFGQRVKILEPPQVVEGMRNFINNISTIYEEAPPQKTQK